MSDKGNSRKTNNSRTRQTTSSSSSPRNDDENRENRGGGARAGAGAGGASQSSASISHADPYAALNLSRDADDDAIQRSYKALSRAFHPDKQPPGYKREAAQEVFVDFKNAYDTLTDPVLRQAYDEHGHYGVYFLRRVMNSADDTLFQTLSRLHRSGNKDAARDVLNEAIQFNQYQNYVHDTPVSASVELKCTTVHSRFLGEGPEHSIVPELEKTSMSISASSTPRTDSRWSWTMGGQSTVKNGEGHASGQIGVGYNPVQGTDVNVDFEVGDPCKVTIGTTRVMSTRTLVTAGVSTIPRSNKLAFSLSSHRALFENKIRGTWAMGIGSDLGVHYTLVSFTTLYESMPKITVRLNLGIDKLPLRISAEHNFSESHTGRVSYGWGASGIEFRTMVTRALAQYAAFGIGVRHATERGLTWLFQLKRGDVSLTIPVTVSTVTSPGYAFKLMYITFLSALIEEAVGDLVTDAKTRVSVDETTKAALRREEELMEFSKAKRDAQRQVVLMTKPAEDKRKIEEARDGLVILKASYWAEGGDKIDATTQLQFWVTNSSLSLPSSPKSNMLGFYDVAAPSINSTNVLDNNSSGASWWSSWRQWLWPDAVTRSTVQPIPQVSVRYKIGGTVYEITVRDDEPLVLPHPDASILGSSDVVS